jgi:hypothetical protein
MLTNHPSVFAFIVVRPPRRQSALERAERGMCNSLAKVFETSRFIWSGRTSPNRRGLSARSPAFDRVKATRGAVSDRMEL